MARRVSLIHVRSSPSNLGSFIFSLHPEFAIKRMAEQLCCGRVIYKYSYRSKLKILYFPMMPLLSQTNFPDKHETAPVASPLDKRIPWKIMKSGGKGCDFHWEGVCVCGSLLMPLSVCEIFGGGCVAMVGAFPTDFSQWPESLFSTSLS